MKVLKFGGTSVGTPESINTVIEIIIERKSFGEKVAVVFSAMGGVTNKLIEVGELASMGDPSYLEVLKSVEERHMNTLKKLNDVKQQSSLIAQIKGIFNEIEDILKGITFIRELSPRTMDLLLSFGERLSTSIITFTLKARGVETVYVDTRKVIKTNSHFGFAEVDFVSTDTLVKEALQSETPVYCITGFIASNFEGITTTLGRGGSDYTASIIGAALGADVIEIWTDVNGMMTADPRKVKNAFTIPEISYTEAMELSHFGAKVIYPPSLVPAFLKNIPIRILNTFASHHAGTTISKEIKQKAYSITGISSIDDIALVNLQGNGMIGVAGVSAKVFGLLAENKISVILISQASSEHSICFAIDPKSSDKVKQILEDGFKQDIKNGDIESIAIQNNLSIIAVVGEGMKASSGTSGKLFSVLGKNGINVIATAQGSSELNISVVITKKDISKALNAIHEAFFEIDGITLNLFLLGPTGLIGKTLLKQMAEQAEHLKKYKNLNIRLVGIANTKKMLLNSNSIAISRWAELLEKEGEKLNLSEFIEDIQVLNLPNSIFIDCTADKDIVQHYVPILNSSISIVTPNKVANSGSYQQYEALQSITRKRNVKFLYETNVGAGLPIINTLQGLINSGDQIHKIEAVLSGTLSYIFNTFSVGDKFVDIVKDAKAKGYTEPDPRDDLSGTDVARKILILARETGLKIEMNEVSIDPLISQRAVSAKTVADFYQVLEEENGHYEELMNQAAKQGCVLRFVASLENGQARLGLKAVDKSHPFFSLAGSENIISFTSERYPNNPLVVKGPGAGAEVTAMGVFADIISLSSFLS
jgi:bifunctional aspartokinase / homoserine dehydrogenase 1